MQNLRNISNFSDELLNIKVKNRFFRNSLTCSVCVCVSVYIVIGKTIIKFKTLGTFQIF